MIEYDANFFLVGRGELIIASDLPRSYRVPVQIEVKVNYCPTATCATSTLPLSATERTEPGTGKRQTPQQQTNSTSIVVTPSIVTPWGTPLSYLMGAHGA
jgi:hypothetical protein